MFLIAHEAAADNTKTSLNCDGVQVSVRILGGLMALGYEIGTIMKRNSIIHSDDRLTIKLDTIEGMGHGFVQVSHQYTVHIQIPLASRIGALTALQEQHVFRLKSMLKL